MSSLEYLRGEKEITPGFYKKIETKSLRVPLNLYLDKRVLEKLNIFCEINDQIRSHLIEKIISDFLEKNNGN